MNTLSMKSSIASTLRRCLKELKLIKSGWISKVDSSKIGEMVGAHIFIMFDKGLYQEKEYLYGKAFDVQTRVLLGSDRIDPTFLFSSNDGAETINQSVRKLMTDIADRLTYISTIESVKGTDVLLKHGPLFGAKEGMTLRVLNRQGNTVGLLEVKDVDRGFPMAIAINGKKKIKPGLRVKEVKDNELTSPKVSKVF